MQRFTKIKCCICGLEVEKPKGEIKRRIKLGKIEFYCSRKCACKHPRKNKSKEIVKDCLFCKGKFTTITKKRVAKPVLALVLLN